MVKDSMLKESTVSNDAAAPAELTLVALNARWSHLMRQASARARYGSATTVAYLPHDLYDDIAECARQIREAKRLLQGDPEECLGI